MNIPSLTKYNFTKLENKLLEIYSQGLLSAMDKAGKEEYEKAVEKGNVDDDGIPWISVYLDGGWSKRSYGHNYNANSGVGVIIGRETRKVLYIGVRNKYCVNCARAADKNKKPTDHICFRNWSGSSAAMESDIIVEGFNSSISMHNLRYKEFVADGDSSVYARIRERVPYGHQVKKLECINHAIKNYGKALYKIKGDSKISLQGRKYITVPTIKKLQNEAKKVIYKWKTNEKNVSVFQETLKNTILDVFSEKHITDMKKCSVFNHKIGAIEILIKKAPRLIKSETNNSAECYMNILARFTAGKRLNLIQRGSFQMRSYLAGMRYNIGVQWHTSPWKKFMKRSPGVHFKRYMQNHKKCIQHKRTTKKFVKKNLQDTYKNKDYGAGAEEPELNEEEYTAESNRILNSLQVNREEQIQLENNTKGQFQNDLYLNVKQIRLTASNFGSVVKRKTTTPCHNLVKTILYPKPFYGAAVEYGIIKETIVKERFQREWNLKVEESGLFIDAEYGFLGASPDGLIGNDSIIEIKCLYSLSNNFDPWEKVLEQTKKTICLHKHKDKIKLRRTHNYYYQIQGQLHISGREKCYFIVYKNDDSELFIETIKKDDNFWEQQMLEKLINFYKNCILPEIINKRIPKGMKCESK